MRLLFICAHERYLCTNSTYRDIVQHYVEHGKHQAKVVCTSLSTSVITDWEWPRHFTEEDFNVYNPDVVIFFSIANDDRWVKFASRRPVYICALDYFNCSIVDDGSTGKCSGFITFPRQPDVIKRYRDEFPHKSFFSFDGRFVNTSIYKNRNEPKKYDILLYGGRSNRNRVRNLTAEQSYKTRWEKYHGSKLPPIHDFYPLRKRLERLLRRNGDRYNIRILGEWASMNIGTSHTKPILALGPTGESEYVGAQECPKNEECVGGYVNESLSKLINQSWLTLCTSSRVDILMDKYVEAAASHSAILGNIPSDYEHIFKGNIVEVTEWMSDEEILSTIDRALEDKHKLKAMIDKTAELVTRQFDLNSATKKMDRAFDTMIHTTSELQRYSFLNQQQMTNMYPIVATSNKHQEQLSGAYLDLNFWPGFQDTLELFKKTLINAVSKKLPYSLLRISHSEMSCLYLACEIKKQWKGQPFRGRQSLTGIVSKKAFSEIFESILNASSLSTQIGYDFEEWIWEALRFTDCYKKDLPLDQYNKSLTAPKKGLKDMIQFPMDIVYGLVANKWIFKTFKNRIGLIGAAEKLAVTKRLMEYKEYQEYLGTDYFTDYIGLPQRGAFDDEHLSDRIKNEVAASSCDIFLIGAGVSKLRFFHILKKAKNCVYLDVGHGICLIAGHGDNTRPYCGEWVNYKLPDMKESIDILGRNKGPIFALPQKAPQVPPQAPQAPPQAPPPRRVPIDRRRLLLAMRIAQQRRRRRGRMGLWR